MKLQAEADRTDGVRVLAARGELDAAVAPAMIPEVAHLVAGATGVVLDLSALTFFDSAGVRLVDQMARACARVAAPFRVVAPPRAPSRRVLELVGLAEPLAVDDVATALAAVAPRASPGS
jgi:anti-sigma B factor antagonist